MKNNFGNKSSIPGSLCATAGDLRPSIDRVNRRALLGAISLAALGAGARRLSAASPFWETKPSSQWTTEEMAELINKSPWAKQVLAQYRAAMDDPRIQAGAEPVQGRGEARAGECGLVPCSSIMPGKVVVIWESAQPVREVLHAPIPAEMNGRYVISVRGLAGDYAGDKLAATSDLSAKGKPPVQAGIVRRRNSTWLFGFSKELVSLNRDDKDVQFTVHTGSKMTDTLLRATFQPKEMIYRGVLAV